MAIEFIDQEKCIGCGVCMQSCSVDVIRLDKELKKAVIKYAEDCMVCLMCQVYCKTGAITITPDKIGNLILSWG